MSCCDALSLCPPQDLVLRRMPNKSRLVVSSGTVLVAFFASSPVTLTIALTSNGCPASTVTVINLALSDVAVNVTWGSSGRRSVVRNIPYAEGMNFYFISDTMGWANTALFTVSAPSLTYGRTLGSGDGCDLFQPGTLYTSAITNPTWINTYAGITFQYPNTNPGTLQQPEATITSGSYCLPQPPPPTIYLTYLLPDGVNYLQMQAVIDQQTAQQFTCHLVLDEGDSVTTGPTYGNYDPVYSLQYGTSTTTVYQETFSALLAGGMVTSIDFLLYQGNATVALTYSFYNPTAPAYYLVNATEGSPGISYIAGNESPPGNQFLLANDSPGQDPVSGEYPNIVSFTPPVFNAVSTSNTNNPAVPNNFFPVNLTVTFPSPNNVIEVGAVCFQYTPGNQSYSTVYGGPPVTFSGYYYTQFNMSIPCIYFNKQADVTASTIASATYPGPVLVNATSGSGTATEDVITSNTPAFVVVVGMTFLGGTNPMCFQMSYQQTPPVVGAPNTIPFCMALANANQVAEPAVAVVQGSSENRLVVTGASTSNTYTFQAFSQPTFVINTVSFYPSDDSGNPIASPDPMFEVTFIDFKNIPYVPQ